MYACMCFPIPNAYNLYEIAMMLSNNIISGQHIQAKRFLSQQEQLPLDDLLRFPAGEARKIPESEYRREACSRTVNPVTYYDFPHSFL